MSILIVAEHDNAQLKPETYKTMSAALKISESTDKTISILVAGFQCQAVAEQSALIQGVSNVIVADEEALQHHLAEPLAATILSIANTYEHILATAQTTGKNAMPRVAALLDVNQISDIISVENEDTFSRPIYAGNAIATVKALDATKIITVRASAFDTAPCSESTAEACEIVSISAVVNDFTIENTQSSHVSYDIAKSERPELTSANVVISGGRGLQNGENFSLLETLADKLNGAVGASRAAVDAGFVSNDLQVGQTGKIVAPNLYIAVGISGAIQHLAGMKDSKVIVAINKDPDAPIFQIADYGLVADLFDVVPELTDKL